MTDVLIIGAGPSGAVAAALLARRGYEVLVLERQKFPRFSIGESLLANSMQFVEEAGMLEAVLACGFQFKNGAAFVHADRYAEYNFAQKSSAGYCYTFQVPRADFDKALADEAARQGAQIHYQVEIKGVDFSGERPVLETCDAAGVRATQSARFVLDASGFGRTLPRMLGLERPSDFPVRAALYTQVEDRIASGAFDRQKIRVAIHPTARDVWYWLIPFSNGRCSLGVVATPGFHTRFAGTPEERLWQLVREEPQLAALLANSRSFGQPVGGPYTEPAFRSIAWRGRLLVVGFAAGEIPKLPLNLALLKGAAVVGVFWGDFARREPERFAGSVRQLAKWYQEGRLRPHVSETFPLEKAAEALKRMAARQVKGKVVLTVG